MSLSLEGAVPARTLGNESFFVQVSACRGFPFAVPLGGIGTRRGHATITAVIEPALDRGLLPLVRRRRPGALVRRGEKGVVRMRAPGCSQGRIMYVLDQREITVG